MDQLRDYLSVCYSYMAEYEGNDVYHACLKVKEAIFYIDCHLENYK